MRRWSWNTGGRRVGNVDDRGKCGRTRIVIHDEPRHGRRADGTGALAVVIVPSVRRAKEPGEPTTAVHLVGPTWNLDVAFRNEGVEDSR